jgi:hypothetical protein
MSKEVTACSSGLTPPSWDPACSGNLSDLLKYYPTLGEITCPPGSGDFGTVLSVPLYSRAHTNWEQELNDDEIIENSDGRRIVLLRGLQRLSRLAGIIQSYPKSLSHVAGPDGKGVIQCIYMTAWDDNTIFGATADANRLNLNPDFVGYPTTIAESRAEGRALRKALGITL